MERLKAVLIDDNKVNLLLMKEYTNRLNLNVRSYDDPVMALRETADWQPDIVFVDYLMPQMNGIEFIDSFRKQNKNTPIIMVTGSNDDDRVRRGALQAGATEFLMKPIDYVEFCLRSTNLLHLKQYQNMIDDRALALEREVREDARVLADSEREVVFVLAKAAEYKDPETGRHIMRVSHYSRLLAEFSRLDRSFTEMIYDCAPLHDVGKVGIPDRILQKRGKLTPEEFQTMQKHTLIGYDILDNTHSKYLEMGKMIAVSHHEKYDGTGYPYGLAGKEIPVAGRIVAIADVFDALLSRRPYKQAWSFEKALEYVASQKGKHFDPVFVDVFLNNVERFRAIYGTYRDEPGRGPTREY